MQKYPPSHTHFTRSKAQVAGDPDDFDDKTRELIERQTLCKSKKRRAKRHDFSVMYHRLASDLFPPTTQTNQTIKSLNLYSKDVIIDFIKKFTDCRNYSNIHHIHDQKITEIYLDSLLIFRFKCSKYRFKIDTPKTNTIPEVLRNGKKYRFTNKYYRWYYSNCAESFIRVLCSMASIIDTHNNIISTEERLLKLIDFAEEFYITTLVNFSLTHHQMLYSRGISNEIVVFGSSQRYCYIARSHSSNIKTRFTELATACPEVRIKFCPEILGVDNNEWYFKLCYDGTINYCSLVGKGFSINSLIEKYLSNDFNQHIIHRIKQILISKTFLVHQLLKELVPIELNFIIMMSYIESIYFDWSI